MAAGCRRLTGAVFVRSGPGDTPPAPAAWLSVRACSRLPGGDSTPGTGQAWVTMDFLGFGLVRTSHRYSLAEQAHLVETVVAHTASARSSCRLHDMGHVETTELLAQNLTGWLPFDSHVRC